MSKRLTVTCPSCLRSDLRIVPEYLGKTVICKLCGQLFLAAAEDEPAPASESQTTDTFADDESPADNELDVELAAGNEPAEDPAPDPEGSLLQLRRAAEQRLGHFVSQVHHLEDELAEAHRQSEGLRADLASLGSERDALRAELRLAVEQAGSQQSALTSLEQELTAAREQAAAAAQLTDEAANELNRLRAEIGQLREQFGAERDEHARRLAAARAELEEARGAAVQPGTTPEAVPMAGIEPAAPSDLETALRRLEELAGELDRSRAANERLRSLLALFGLTTHVEG